MKHLSRLALAVLLTTAIAPAFARGQPQLPDDDGGRASVLRALDPTRASGAPRPRVAAVTETQARPSATHVRHSDAAPQ
ncbi:hypothetical protein ACVBGC_17300 [Burkholderia stagnalis]